MSAPSPHFKRGYHAGSAAARETVEAVLTEVRAQLYVLMKREAELQQQLQD